MLSCFLTQPLQVASGEREKASPWYLGHFITDECGRDQLSNAPVLRAGSPVLLLTPPPRPSPLSSGSVPLCCRPNKVQGPLSQNVA